MTDDERELLLLLAARALESNTRPLESKIGQLAQRVHNAAQLASYDEEE